MALSGPPEKAELLRCTVEAGPAHTPPGLAWAPPLRPRRPRCTPRGHPLEHEPGPLARLSRTPTPARGCSLPIPSRRPRTELGGAPGFAGWVGAGDAHQARLRGRGAGRGRGVGGADEGGDSSLQLACPTDSVTCWKVLTLGPSGAKDGAGAEQEFISVQSLGLSTCRWGCGPAPCPSVPPSAVTWPQQACSASFALTFRSWKQGVRGVSRSHEVMRLEPSSSLGSSAPSFPASEPLCTECAPPMGEGN